MKASFSVMAGCLIAAATSALAVGTSNWTHTTEADFKNGTFENVVPTNLGDLKLSRAVKTLLEQDPQISTVSALAEAPDGAIYAGTGPHGVLLKVKGETVARVATIDDATAINSLTFDDKGRLLIGTGGESGKVLRLEKATLEKAGDEEAVAKPTEVFAAEGVQYVWQVRQTADGNLYVATGPTGQLYEVKPDGTKRLVLDSDENNLTALISDGRDMLYVGTDPNGLVYRVNRKTGDSFVLFDAPEAEISALLIDPKGYIYASTAEAKEEGGAAAAGAAETGGRPEGGATGVPIKSEPPKAPEPPKLPDPNPGRPDPIPNAPAPEKSVQPEREKSAAGIGVGLGHLLVGVVGIDAPFDEAKATDSASPERTKPSPKNPRPNPPPVPPPPGGAQPATNPSAPAPGRQPVVPAGVAQPKPEGNAIYRIDQDGFVTEVFRQTVLILAMVERDGKLLIATGSEGQVYQVDPAAEETLVVARIEPKQIMSLLPAKDGRLFLGTANVGGIAAMSSGFAAKGTYTSPVLDATQISRFGKIHLHGSLAAGAKITVATRSGNVQEAGEKGGWSPWTAEAPVTEFFQVKSPSARFLQYRMTFTSDGGKSTPVIEDVNIAYQVPNLAPQVKAVTVTPVANPAAANAEAGAAAAPAAGPKVTIAWEASDPNADALQYAISFRRGGPDAPWILLKDKLAEATYEWDTRSVADGRYEIRVTASDAAANVPGRGKTAGRVSDPVDVDNTSPVIGDLRYDQHGPDVKVSFRAVDRTGVLASADYSVDSSKDWQAVLPTDSIWDSPEDAAEFTIAGLPPGVHQVTVRATDAKGNQAFENVFVKIQGPAAAK